MRYRSGTRLPDGATIHLAERDGTSFTVDIDVLGSMALSVGCGYGGDPAWAHGQ